MEQVAAFLLTGMTKAQLSALRRLTPGALYDHRIVNGRVRESLWRLRLIEKVSSGRAAETAPRIHLTSLGCAVLATLG
jgi:hypothetical protein